MTHTKLGRRQHLDPRDHNYLIPALPSLPLPTHRLWTLPATHLNQGNTGTCVGHGWRNFLRAIPIATTAAKPSAYDIYRSAVLLDPWSDNDDEASLPDSDPGLDSGTTVRAGAKALAAMGKLTSYSWAFSLGPAVNWLLGKGPIVVGTDWHEDMSNPDVHGVVDIGGEIVGGHCYLVRGADTQTRMVRCSNSWGNSWGYRGDFFMSFDSLDALIRVGGEACTAVQKN